MNIESFNDVLQFIKKYIVLHPRKSIFTWIKYLLLVAIAAQLIWALTMIFFVQGQVALNLQETNETLSFSQPVRSEYILISDSGIQGNIGIGSFTDNTHTQSSISSPNKAISVVHNSKISCNNFKARIVSTDLRYSPFCNIYLPINWPSSFIEHPPYTYR